jgi:hypothetical protein
MTIGFFEAIDTIVKFTMTMQVKDLLSFYNLLDKMIACVKDEGGNLSTLAQALSFVVSCTHVALVAPRQGSCSRHAFNKACQYVTNDATICSSFWEVNLKATYSTLQKTITWTKKSRKGRSKWKKACFDARLSHQKLKTPMKIMFVNKMILFQETVEYWDAINFRFGRQETLELQGRIMDAHTWVICKGITKTIIHVVKQCILN